MNPLSANFVNREYINNGKIVLIPTDSRACRIIYPQKKGKLLLKQILGSIILQIISHLR